MKVRYFAFLKRDAENCGCGIFVANFAASATEHGRTRRRAPARQRGRSEFVVQGAADDLRREGHIKRAADGARGAARSLAEIGVEIFELGRPAVDEGVF